MKRFKGMLSILMPIFMLISCSSEDLIDFLEQDTTPPKAGLLVVTLNVKDPDKFNNEYFPIASETLKAASATVLLKGINPEVLHGENDKKVILVVKFPSQAAINDWYNSPEYQAVIPIRRESADTVFTSYEIADEVEGVTGDGLLAVNITVKDAAKFDTYFSQALPTLADADAKLQFKGGNPEVIHGTNPHKVIVLFRFENKEKVIEWYNSDDYQALIPLRLEAADTVFTAYEIAK